MIAHASAILAQGVAIATNNLNARLERNYGEMQEGMAGAMANIHTILAGRQVVLDMLLDPMRQNISEAHAAKLDGIYGGIQEVHDAVYNRLATNLDTLSQRISR